MENTNMEIESHTEANKEEEFQFDYKFETQKAQETKKDDRDKLDSKFDVIILGTGLIECVLGGMLSVYKYKTLQVDRNPYYGNESTSLSLDQIYENFSKGKPPAHLGPSREYNIDTIFKLILSRGELVDILVALGVNRYLKFQKLGGSFVYRNKTLYKVPVEKSEVIFTTLIGGFFQKKYLHSFLSDVNKYFIENNQLPPGFTSQTTMKQVFDKYDLDASNRELVGHVLASHQDDDYLNLPCVETFERIRTYRNSLAFTVESPFLYPEYGVGELPQAFARLAAVYGAVYKLNSDVQDVKFDSEGKVRSVMIDGEVIETKYVIADPSYFPDRVTTVRKKVRCICIFNHPVHQIETVTSAQIIIPAQQLGRKSDVYVAVTSSTMMSTPRGMYVGIVTTNHECQDPYDDVKVGVELLQPVVEKFCWVSDIKVPNDDGVSSNIFISSSYDASTLYEPVLAQIKDIWKKITDKEFDLEFCRNATKQLDQPE